MLSAFEESQGNKSHIFLTICEVAPGIIWAGGYSSGAYQIDKKTFSVSYFMPPLYTHTNKRPDKYIRDIRTDMQGYIWSGGFYNLKRINLKTQEVRFYDGLNSITAIVEKDEKKYVDR